MFDLAVHTDRALRTATARAAAASVYRTIVLAAQGSARPRVEAISLQLLMSRPGWRRQGSREFVHRFGRRQCALEIPQQFEPRSFATLVLRTEMKTMSADCDWRLASELRAMAERELQRLCTA